MSFEGLVRICGGEQPPIPAAKMTFLCWFSAEMGRRPPPAFIEADLLRSKSVGGGKHELQCNEEKWKDMQQHLKERCSLKLHLSTHRPRGKTRRRALCVCAHRLRKKKEDNHPKFSGPEGQKVHEKRNPDEVLFSGRSTVLATKLGERLSAHRKEVQSAHCEARAKSLVDEAKKLGWMPASLLSMLKGTGDASATEAAAASPNDEGLGEEPTLPLSLCHLQ